MNLKNTIIRVLFFGVLLGILMMIVILISFTIHDTKEFMHLLLKQNIFDSFCIYRMDITTFALFQIDGYKNV